MIQPGMTKRKRSEHYVNNKEFLAALIEYRTLVEIAYRKKLINKYKDSKTKILHAWHDDKGFRAAKIRNEAVKLSSGEYLIFVDGDCIVFDDFIGNHRKISEKGDYR